MKYKAGDKVKIKSLEWYNSADKNEDGHIEGYNGVLFTMGMTKYCGCDAKIIEVRSSSEWKEFAKLDIDGCDWYWYDWMFDESFSDKEESPTDYDYEQLKEIAIELIRANVSPREVALWAKGIYKELKKK